LAFASFGIITPVLSVVISVFMLGLALGSWAGGRWIEPLTQSTGRSALFFYALAELIIGIGAFAVPALFALGNRLLLASGEMGSVRYLSLSALVLGFSILPWCVFMGMTFPLMLDYLKEESEKAGTNFSYLYVPNVLGAMTGTLLTALVLVEWLGFRNTLHVAAFGNFLIAGTALFIAMRAPVRSPQELIPITLSPTRRIGEQKLALTPHSPSRLIPWILFWT